MKKIYFSTITLLLTGLFMAFSASSQESLKITTGDIELTAGETLVLTAEYTDADGIVQDVELQWYLEPDTLGTIDAGVFTAEKPGEGFLYAQYGELLDTVEVEIEAVEEEDEYPSLEILNDDIDLETGETAALAAEYTDADGIVQDVELQWYLVPDTLGTIDAGIFTAENPGEGFLYVQYGELLDSVEVEVEAVEEEDEYPSLEILNDDIDLETGETAALVTEYTDADGIVQDVELQWYLVPDTMGTIDAGIFTAEKPGEGFLYVQYGELLDSVEVEVEAIEEETEEDEEEPANWGTLEIVNDDIQLEPGGSILLEAVYTDTTGTVQEVKIKWHAEPGYLGKADRDGNFTAKHPGEGMLYARYRSLSDSIQITVEGEIKAESEEEEVEDEIDYPKVKVIPGMIKIAAGDSVELVAFYVNELDEKEDTTFMWSVIPEELGEFPDPYSNKFFAGDFPGEGWIVATLKDGELADTVKLRITEPKKNKNKGENNGRKIEIVPGDTVVNAGDLASIQYDAIHYGNQNIPEGEFEWSISGAPVGEIDETTGLLTLSGETGLALIKAKYNNFGTTVELLVVDPEADTEINTITIHRVLPDGNELPAKTINEGESYKIGGLPFPLNILNGGMLHFPFGSLEEDIILYMFIPEEYAETEEETNEVGFSEEVIAGVKFSVKPVDSVKIEEPYYFNIPINLAMVFKHELLDSLGINPEELDVFFADNTGFISEGTENVTVDTVDNKIYAAIEHFSTIVVKQKSATFSNELTMDVEDRMIIYPNPFTNSTKISFEISKRTDVQLEIYNIYGQKVKTLMRETRREGTHSIVWNGTTESNQLVTPGIYFCRMILDGNQTEVKRLIVNR